MKKQHTMTRLEFNRYLRARRTPEERKLWCELRAGRLGVRFFQQVQILAYHVDFYCRERKLAVEVDGGYHDDPAQRRHDYGRDKALKGHGVRVLRIRNDAVNDDLPAAIAAIAAALNLPPLAPRQPVRRENPTGMPIGILIRNMMRKGYSYRDAVDCARSIAEKR